MLNKRNFPCAIIEHFKRHFLNWNTGLDFEAFAIANLYLITVHVTSDSPDAAMLRYRLLHFEFLKQLLGKNIGKKVGIQPFGYAFIDFAGTRHGWSSFVTMPHVHALLMFHPDTRERLDEIMSDVELFRHHRLIYAEGEDLGYVASYCLKGIYGVHRAYHQRDQYWEVFPRLAAPSLKSWRSQ